MNTKKITILSFVTLVFSLLVLLMPAFTLAFTWGGAYAPDPDPWLGTTEYEFANDDYNDYGGGGGYDYAEWEPSDYDMGTPDVNNDGDPTNDDIWEPSDWPSDDNDGGGGGGGYTGGGGSGARAVTQITPADYTKAIAQITDPAAIVKVAAQVAGMTTPQFLAYVATLNTVDQIVAQAARNLGNDRDVVIDGDSIEVAWCNNGVGGEWLVMEPPVVNRLETSDWPSDSDNDDPPQNPAFCSYLLANGQAGNVTISEPGPVTLSWQVNYAESGTITPEPGAFNKRVGSASVNVTKDTVFELKTSNAYGSDSCAVNVTIGEGEEICTDSSAENYKATGACTYKNTSGNPTVSAVIEALVFIEGGGVYSGDDRYVAASNLTDENPDNDYPIYLRWQGVQSNGKLANYCIGTTPEDYTAPGNAAKGSFEEGDGRGTPYPGLENGESKTYTVQCFNDYGSDTDSVTLTGITDFTGQPPTITADGKPKLAIVPYGKEVEIAWNPNGNLSCSLSNNLKTNISNPATSNTSGAQTSSGSPAKGVSGTNSAQGTTPGNTGSWFNNTQTSSGSPAKGRSNTPVE